MSQPKIYLAGPINSLTYKQATEWRQDATSALAAWGITAYSPMRSKAFLREVSDLTWKKDAWSDPMATSKGIQCRDYTDCTRADAIIMNFKGSTKASIGTCFELAWAYHLRIPVIVIAEADNLHVDHPMATEMINFRVDTLEQAIAIARSILLPTGEAA